tara:strand:+ start:162 stop:494 length:333 start_codon:yes stop_codon:yes gene_type:complete
MKVTPKRLGWIKKGDWYTNEKYPFWRIQKIIYPGIHNPYSLYYTDPNNITKRIAQLPTWYWIWDFFLDTAKRFQKDPSSFKAAVGYYTDKKTGKYKNKTRNEFADLAPRL